MRLGIFGRRRREGQHEEATPDEPAGLEVAESTEESEEGTPEAGRPPAPPIDKSRIPRWRRASLREARKADPFAEPPRPEPLTFRTGTSAPLPGLELHRVRYRLVRLLADPDELRSVELSILDQDDEVQVIEASGLYRRVRCPDGREGWLHRMTLSEPLGPEVLQDYLDSTQRA